MDQEQFRVADPQERQAAMLVKARSRLAWAAGFADRLSSNSPVAELPYDMSRLIADQLRFCDVQQPGTSFRYAGHSWISLRYNSGLPHMLFARSITGSAGLIVCRTRKTLLVGVTEGDLYDTSTSSSEERRAGQHCCAMELGVMADSLMQYGM